MGILFIIVLVFLIGLVLGSFLNVVVDRSVEGKSFVSGRSKCAYCHRELSPIELLPLVSYVMQGGKCKHCSKKLSIYYPVVELTTGILFVIAMYDIIGNTPLSPPTYGILDATYGMYIFAVISVLIIIFFTDLKYGLIPFYTTLLAILVVFLKNIFFPLYDDLSLINYFFSAFFSLIFFLILFLATKGRGMGFGDVVYVFLMGLLLGFPKIVLGMYIAFLSGTVVALFLVFLKKKKMKGGTIPFGPFLVAGTVISFFWGNMIIDGIMKYLVMI